MDTVASDPTDKKTIYLVRGARLDLDASATEEIIAKYIQTRVESGEFVITDDYVAPVDHAVDGVTVTANVRFVMLQPKPRAS